MPDGRPAVVHILSMGLALCQSVDKTPAKWPSGHEGQKLTDYLADPAAGPGPNRMYCSACLPLAGIYLGKGKE
jgi:hypothetical protein